MSGHLQPEVTKLPRLDQFLKTSITSNLQQISEPYAARMAEEKFSLRWNDFQASLSSSFQQFRGQLTDVELCCLGVGEGGGGVAVGREGRKGGGGVTVVAAHRLVLCACSATLREVLLGTGAR